MAKAAKPSAKPKKAKPKFTDTEQSERFIETARELGVDDKNSAEQFDSAFKKIVIAPTAK